MKVGRLTVVGLSLIPIIMGGCPLSSDLTALLGIQATQQTTTVDADTKYDIALMAGAGTSTLVSEGVYDFVLTDVPTYALAFSESPDREVYYIPLEGLGLWSKLFPDGDPNTVLYERTADSEEIVVFQMDQPTYDADAGTLTFRATLLAGSPAPPATMGHIELLIDPTTGEWINICVSCGVAILGALGAAATMGAGAPALVGLAPGCAIAIATAHW